MAENKQWKAKNDEVKAAIIIEKIKNPDASLRDIAQKVDANKDTVWKTIKEDLPVVAAKSERIRKIVDNDKEILELWTAISLDKFRRLHKNGKSQENPNWIDYELNDVKTMNEILDKAKWRVILLWGTITDEEWGLKLTSDEIDNTPLDEVKLHIQSLINKKK